jgi:hypothetical protein
MHPEKINWRKIYNGEVVRDKYLCKRQTEEQGYKG